MLKNRTFVNNSVFEKTGRMYGHKLADYETCKAFVREKGNALFNEEHELCFLISVEKDGLYAYSADDLSVCDVRPWTEENDPCEDFFCNFQSLDYTAFVYWDFDEGESECWS